MRDRSTPIETNAARRSVESLSIRYGSVLLRYFTRRGISAPDAQDLVQEVFARLLQKDDLDHVQSADRYLFVTAANLARDYFRYQKVRVAHPVTGFADELHRMDDFDPERILGGRQELDILIAALNEMPERMRNIFILARLENLSRLEIAQRLGVSKRTVEAQITLATACLAERRRRVT
ncbi:sigma-70 family RNA polymerase sigma factor [Sphingomonas sp. ST-64]|uniref:Sigma-70 family RNA polymerase sigma factor n=1 Tax=Sphingomonas plantiphila TaxID=3163295 RepID=A0ABW8YK24_9SPHN